MKRYGLHRFICVVFVIGFTAASVCAADYSYDVNPPFSTTGLEKVKLAGEVNAFDPRNPYNIFINYELGMHCVGFDVSYCCVIPPYNSVQAQAVKAGTKGGLPMLLSPDDGYSPYKRQQLQRRQQNEVLGSEKGRFWKWQHE
jgi:hypothetical protein